MASLGVAELKAMLAEKRRRNLEEMARSMSLDRSVDSISVESEFVSLVWRVEEGLVGR